MKSPTKAALLAWCIAAKDFLEALAEGGGDKEGSFGPVFWAAACGSDLDEEHERALHRAYGRILSSCPALPPATAPRASS